MRQVVISKQLESFGGHLKILVTSLEGEFPSGEMTKTFYLKSYWIEEHSCWYYCFVDAMYSTPMVMYLRLSSKTIEELIQLTREQSITNKNTVQFFINDEEVDLIKSATTTKSNIMKYVEINDELVGKLQMLTSKYKNVHILEKHHENYGFASRKNPTCYIGNYKVGTLPTLITLCKRICVENSVPYLFAIDGEEVELVNLNSIVIEMKHYHTYAEDTIYLKCVGGKYYWIAGKSNNTPIFLTGSTESLNRLLELTTKWLYHTNYKFVGNIIINGVTHEFNSWCRKQLGIVESNPPTMVKEDQYTMEVKNPFNRLDVYTLKRQNSQYYWTNSSTNRTSRFYDTILESMIYFHFNKGFMTFKRNGEVIDFDGWIANAEKRVKVVEPTPFVFDVNTTIKHKVVGFYGSRIVRYIVYQNNDNKWYWHCYSGDDRPVFARGFYDSIEALYIKLILCATRLRGHTDGFTICYQGKEHDLLTWCQSHKEEIKTICRNRKPAPIKTINADARVVFAAYPHFGKSLFVTQYLTLLDIAKKQSNSSLEMSDDAILKRWHESLRIGLKTHSDLLDHKSALMLSSDADLSMSSKSPVKQEEQSARFCGVPIKNFRFNNIDDIHYSVSENVETTYNHLIALWKTIEIPDATLVFENVHTNHSNDGIRTLKSTNFKYKCKTSEKQSSITFMIKQNSDNSTYLLIIGEERIKFEQQ